MMPNPVIEHIDEAIESLATRSFIGTDTAIDMLLDVRSRVSSDYYSDETKEGWLNKMEDMDPDLFERYQEDLDEQSERMGPEPMRPEE
jgi:hypothetical protein